MMKKIGKYFLRTMAFLGTFVVAAALTLIIVLKMFCSDTFPHVQQTFVTTILETGQLKFLASWFLSPEEIQEIVNQNSMKDLNAEVNTDLIQSGSFGNVGVSGETDAGEETADIEIVEVAGATYTGTMMIVKDPSRVSLATIYPWREYGVTLKDLVEDNEALAGINGGLYNSSDNTGGQPVRCDCVKR